MSAPPGLNDGTGNFPVQHPAPVQAGAGTTTAAAGATAAAAGAPQAPAAQRFVLVEFVPTGSGFNPSAGGRVGGPLRYDYNDTQVTFIRKARRAAINGEFGIQPGMTTTTLITMYAVWNQGHESVSSLVGNLVEFQRCGLLMEQRNYQDRFQLVYVGHNVNGNGNGNVGGTGSSWL